MKNDIERLIECKKYIDGYYNPFFQNIEFVNGKIYIKQKTDEEMMVIYKIMTEDEQIQEKVHAQYLKDYKDLLKKLKNI